MSQQINLYNPAFVPKRELLTGGSLAAAAAVLLVAVIAGSGWARQEAARRSAGLAAAKVDQAKAKIELEKAKTALERKPSEELVAEVSRQKQRLKRRDEVLAALQGGLGGAGGGFSGYLRGLSRQSVQGLWLTGFSVGPGGSGMSLRGRAIDKALLPDYVKRLNGEKAFAGAAFGGLKIAYQGQPDPVPAPVRAVAAPPAPTPAAAGPASPASPPSPSASAAPAPTAMPASYLEFQLVAVAAEQAPAPGASAVPAGAGR